MSDLLISLRWVPAILGWLASVFFAFVVFTPLGWGMAWSDYDTLQQSQMILIAVAPFVIAVAVLIYGLARRPKRLFPALYLLIAPALDVAFVLHWRFLGGGI